MAFRNIHVAIAATTGNLRPVLAAAAGDVQKFGKNIETADKATSKFGANALKVGGIAALTLGAALVGAATKAVEFDRAMRNVSTLMSLSEKGFQDLGRSVRALSKDPFINQGAVELAKGLYDIASSGFQGAQGLIVLRAAAEAASAGLTTTATSGKAITAVLNAYGRTAIDAEDVSDVLFQTVNLGVVSFEELAAQVGDFVGSAAAAGIPIEDATAAIAAMTLSGVSAAESGTSLNRVIQALIDPSDAMAATLKGLGYESGSAALKQDGLRGVMEKLRGATGGQITAMQRLFPEMRGLRGALALAAADGENYRKTTEGIANAENRAGATRKALKEQMKGVGIQLDKFRNAATATAIEVGTKLLPSILSLLKGVENLARSAMPGVNSAFAAARPLFQALGELGMNLANAAKAVMVQLGPVAGMFAALAGTGLGVVLIGIAKALSAITGFLAENTVILNTAAALYGIKMVAALTASTLALLRHHAAQMAVSMAWKTGMSSAGMMGGAMAGLALGVGVISTVMANAKKNSDQMIESITKDLDLKSLEGLNMALNRSNKEMEEAQKKAEGGKLEAFFQNINPWAENEIQDGIDNIKRLDKETAAFAETAKNMTDNTKAIGSATGLTGTQVKELAKTLGVDLTKGFDESAEAREKIILHFKKLQNETGLSKEKLDILTGGGIEGFERLQKAIEDTTKAVNTAFQKATDIFGETGLKTPEQRAKEQADAADGMATANDRIVEADDRLVEARERVAEAEKKLTEARAGEGVDPAKLADAEDKLATAREAAAKAGATPQELRAVANAERDLAAVKASGAPDAEKIASAEKDLAGTRKDLADATKGVTTAATEASKASAEASKAQVAPAETLKAHFQAQLAEATTFANSIGELTRRGLDPGLIKRLLEQGPAEAAPTIQALLSDNSNTLIGMANETEIKLQEVNGRVIEFARLTALAVSDKTNQLGKDLKTAMAITAQELALGAAATAEAIGAAIGKPTDEVRRIAREYGIILAGEIRGGLGNAVLMAGMKVVVPGEATGSVKQATGGIMAMADGGLTAHITTTPRVLYGERSTGGEAFIPLGRNHRPRSRKLWEQTGEILGMGSGFDQVRPGRGSSIGVAPDARGSWVAGSGGRSGASPTVGSSTQNVTLQLQAPDNAGLVAQAEYASRIVGWTLRRTGRP